MWHSCPSPTSEASVQFPTVVYGFVILSSLLLSLQASRWVFLVLYLLLWLRCRGTLTLGKGPNFATNFVNFAKRIFVSKSAFLNTFRTS